MSWRNQRVASKSFQDHPPSSLKTIARCTCNDTPFKTPANTQDRRKQLKLTPFKTLDVDGIRVTRKMCTKTPFKTPANMQERNEQHRHQLTHFKTPVINGICITKRKDNPNRVKDTVENRGKKTSFKTLSKSGRNKISFQDKEHKVGKANSFKTPVKDTNNESISFKTFDDWVKAKTAHCDTALKDDLSFVSDKKPAVDREKGFTTSKMYMTKEIQPQQYRARQQADRQPKKPPAAQGDPHGQRRDPHGAQQKRIHYGAQESIPHAAKAEAEKPQVQ